MMLLTTQRIIANGLAQLRFQEIWPDLSKLERPTESTLRRMSCPKLLELRWHHGDDRGAHHLEHEVWELADPAVRREASSAIT